MNNQAIIQPVNNDSHQSRWGYHPCDRQTFLKLKRLHKAFWSHLRRSVRWERWNAKQPENRRGPEPTYFPQFTVPKKCQCIAGVYGMFRRADEHPVRKLFQAARYPAADPVAPFDAATLKSIDGTLAAMEKWEAEQE